MEVLEFIKQKNRMCDYYGGSPCTGSPCTNDDSGEICPAHHINCYVMTDNLEQLVAIVEKWEKEHPEGTAATTYHKDDDPCVKTIQDNLEGAIYRSIALNKARIENLEYEVSVIRHDLEVLDDRIYELREKVDHTPTKEASQTPEPKRKNKDVLLAAFPRMVMDGGVPVLCPRTMDRDIHIQHCAVRSCDQCRNEYWLAEVEK